MLAWGYTHRLLWRRGWGIACPDSGEPAPRAEPTKAVIAGKSNEIKEMFHYPSSGVSVFNTQRLQVKAFLGCISSHWLLISGTKEGITLEVLQVRFPPLLPHISVAIRQ